MDELTSELMQRNNLGDLEQAMHEEQHEQEPSQTTEDDVEAATEAPPDEPASTDDADNSTSPAAAAPSSADTAEPADEPHTTVATPCVAVAVAADTPKQKKAAIGPQTLAAVRVFMGNKPSHAEPSVGAAHMFTAAAASLPTSYRDLCQLTQGVCQFLRNTIGVSAYVAQLQVRHTRTATPT